MTEPLRLASGTSILVYPDPATGTAGRGVKPRLRKQVSSDDTFDGGDDAVDGLVSDAAFLLDPPHPAKTKPSTTITPTASQWWQEGRCGLADNKTVLIPREEPYSVSRPELRDDFV
jgi:hypothetical protein